MGEKTLFSPLPRLSLSYPQRQSGASLHKSAEVWRLRHHRRPRPHNQAALAASRKSLKHHPCDQPGGFQCITLQWPLESTVKTCLSLKLRGENDCTDNSSISKSTLQVFHE